MSYLGQEPDRLRVPRLDHILDGSAGPTHENPLRPGIEYIGYPTKNWSMKLSFQAAFFRRARCRGRSKSRPLQRHRLAAPAIADPTAKKREALVEISSLAHPSP